MKQYEKLDVVLLSKELRLLLRFMKMDQDLELIEDMNDIDWGHFLQLAKHHRLYPNLYPKMAKMKKKWIPQYVMKTLHQSYQKNTFQMLHLSGEMIQLCKQFKKQDIQMLLLKGPVLAVELYGDISFRTSSDIDMLIPIHDLKRVDDLLLKEGFVKDDYIETVLGDWKWRHHHVTYFHPKRKVKLEIHWRLNPGPAKEPGFNELWKRKRESSLSSDAVYFLGREDLFLFLVMHGSRHGWSRLRWLVDIHQMVNQGLDWNRATKLMKRYQSLHLGGQALILTSQLFHTKISREMSLLFEGKRSKQLANAALFYYTQMVNLHTIPVPQDIAVYHKYYLFSLMPIQQKILFIMSFLYPYPEDAETLPLPKCFHFLYFPLRPILWVYRKTRKHALP